MMPLSFSTGLGETSCLSTEERREAVLCSANLLNATLNSHF